MLDYTEIKHDRRKFLALTGLTVKEFQSLLPAFSTAKGGGRRGQLPTKAPTLTRM